MNDICIYFFVLIISGGTQKCDTFVLLLFVVVVLCRCSKLFKVILKSFIIMLLLVRTKSVLLSYYVLVMYGANEMQGSKSHLIPKHIWRLTS